MLLESGILELIGNKLTGAEQMKGWARKLRRVRLVQLANLIDRIASTMPPDEIIPDPKCPWSVFREREREWARYLAEHPDDERLIAHDRAWKRARNQWVQERGREPEWPDG